MKLIKIIFLSLLLTSCARKTALTTEIIKKYNFSESSLRQIQLYSSKDIVLSKVQDESNVTVKEGKIFLLDEKNSETVFIKRGTPCILDTMISTNQLIVSFENGANRLLAFGNDNSGSLSLEAVSWFGGKGKLQYAGKTYSAANGDACLLVKARKLNRLKSRMRLVKGRKV